MSRGLGAAAVLLGVALAVTACTDAPDASAPPSPTPRVVSRSPDGQQLALATVRRTIQAYLDDWAAHGAAHASRRYLVGGRRVRSDTGLPNLVAGRVTSSSLYDWQGPSTLTLEVSMRLRFDRSPLAWNRGMNDRFVTARRRGSDGSYLLEFATSP